MPPRSKRKGLLVLCAALVVCAGMALVYALRGHRSVVVPASSQTKESSSAPTQVRPGPLPAACAESLQAAIDETDMFIARGAGGLAPGAVPGDTKPAIEIERRGEGVYKIGVSAAEYSLLLSASGELHGVRGLTVVAPEKLELTATSGELSVGMKPSTRERLQLRADGGASIGDAQIPSGAVLFLKDDAWWLRVPNSPHSDGTPAPTKGPSR